MTTNLLYKNGATAEALTEILDAVKPDILAVQELTPEVAPAITQRFEHHHVLPRTEGPGLGIAADRPVAFEEVAMPYRSGVLAMTQPDHWPEFGGPVEILNAHLGNPIERWPWQMVGIRREQIATIERSGSGAGARRILCGDLNATPLWPAYRRLRRTYRDGVREAKQRLGSRPRRTWAPVPGAPRLLRIDHVLVVGLDVAAAELVRVEGSDHLGVVAELVDGS
jgi:endonuclease/exonuclease/phosphatase family metal-dependent hydrolase